MNKIKIFTSGAMNGLSFKEQMNWRTLLEYSVKDNADKPVEFVHPPMYFDYEYPDQNFVKEWEISQLLSSDIVVINFENIKDSIGTHMEMGAVIGANKVSGKNIHIIGIGKPDTEHPWIESTPLIIVPDVQSASDYIVKYFLV